ncbi:hypothetical protein PHMEG_00017897 [Phytophthora megakarya]|uniref:Uncharacterized protein n=1 Tax=Phytophthora megakarya TaxID=4795 RepID=A0A225VVD4_9STRA|nr:hypothetical protein PHMEG_00017897 [Phytophthora megakarya]
MLRKSRSGTETLQDTRADSALVPRMKYPDVTVATVAVSSKVRDALLVFGSRLRTKLLLHDTRSQSGCGRDEETRMEMDRCVVAAVRCGQTGLDCCADLGTGCPRSSLFPYTSDFAIRCALVIQCMTRKPLS